MTNTVVAATTSAAPAGPVAAKNVVAPAPLGEVTNGVRRTRTTFDEDGEVAVVIEEPVATEEEAVEATEEDAPVEEEEEAAEAAEANPDEAAADEEVAEEGLEADKLAYRNGPSLFAEERCRTATFAGTHTRFEDADEEEATESCPETQAKVDELSAILSKAMDVDAKPVEVEAKRSTRTPSKTAAK